MIYPTLKELLILAVVIAELVGAGFLIKRRWTARNETVPLSVAVGLWIGMFLIYFSVVALLTALRADELLATHGPPATPDELATDPSAAARASAPGETFMIGDPRVQIITTLGWALLLWTIPASYFTWTIVTSLAARNVERIGPFSAKIEDPSEFAAARKLALRGDIDGAVSMYRSYRDNEVNALFEAARLLKSEDRFAETAEVLREVEERFTNRSRIWAEAAYQRARLLESHLGQPGEAQQLLRQILSRAPESRFAQLAGADLARLQIMQGVQFEDDDEHFGAVAAPVPPKPAPKGKATKGEGPATASSGRRGLEDFQPVPPQDPFYAAMKRRRDIAQGGAEAIEEVAVAGQAETAAGGKAKAGPKKKAATGKKAAPKKTAAAKSAGAATAKKKAATKAKPKPVAKKKPAARKKPSDDGASGA